MKFLIIIILLCYQNILFGQCQQYLEQLKTLTKNEICNGVGRNDKEQQDILYKIATNGCVAVVKEWEAWVLKCDVEDVKSCMCGGNSMNITFKKNVKKVYEDLKHFEIIGSNNEYIKKSDKNRCYHDGQYSSDGLNSGKSSCENCGVLLNWDIYNEGRNALSKLKRYKAYDEVDENGNLLKSNSNNSNNTNEANIRETTHRIANTQIIKPTIDDIQLDYDHLKTKYSYNNNTVVDVNNVKQIINSIDAKKETNFNFSEGDFDKTKPQKDEDRFIPAKLSAYTKQEYLQKLQNKIANCYPKNNGDLDIDFSVNETGKLVGVSVKSSPYDKELEDKFSNEVLFTNNVGIIFTPATKNGKPVGDFYNMKISYAANRKVESLTKPLVHEKNEEVKLLPSQVQLSKKEVDEYADEYKQSLKSKVVDFFENLKSKSTLESERKLFGNRVMFFKVIIKEKYNLLKNLGESETKDETILTLEDLEMERIALLKKINEEMLITKKIMIKGVIYRLVSETPVTKMGTYEIDVN